MPDLFCKIILLPPKSTFRAASPFVAPATFIKSSGNLGVALYGKVKIPIINYIYGLGGRDISVDMLRQVIDETNRVSKEGKATLLDGKHLTGFTYLGVRE